MQSDLTVFNDNGLQACERHVQGKCKEQDLCLKDRG